MEFANLQSLVITHLTRARDRIQSRMDNAGVNASGRTRASLQIRNVDSHIQLVGGNATTAPMPTLEIGRVAGKVPYTFTDILYKWSQDKNIQFTTDADRRSFAYLLGRKIARYGTKRNKQHKDIYSTIALETKTDVQKIIRDDIIGAVRKIVISTAKLH